MGRPRAARTCFETNKGGTVMIEEQYVSLDTAKLLKEAGFEANLKTRYVEEEKDEWAFWDSGTKRSDYNYFDDTIACPTQALAARWLREARHYVICAWLAIEEKKWFYAYGDTDDMFLTYDYAISDAIYDTYEEAMEAGIVKCLKLIKK